MDPKAFDFRLPFGQYAGRTLGDVGITGEGLRYLDELSGHQMNPLDLMLALETYLSDPAISAELDTLTGWNE